MKIIKFVVLSNSGNNYNLTFTKVDQKITAKCTCAAGAIGQLCKHRLEILCGDISSISSRNENEVALLFSWLEGTPVADALRQVSEAENNYEDAKKKLSSTKKQLSRLLND